MKATVLNTNTHWPGDRVVQIQRTLTLRIDGSGSEAIFRVNVPSGLVTAHQNGSTIDEICMGQN